MPSMVPPTACDLRHSTVAWGMRIHDILRRKGDSVITIGSDASLGELLALLTEHRIGAVVVSDADGEVTGIVSERDVITRDRKSTRLNSSHVASSYAVFCLKKKIATASILLTST